MKPSFWIIAIIFFMVNILINAAARGDKNKSVWNMQRNKKRKAPSFDQKVARRKVVVNQKKPTKQAEHVFETEFDEDITRATLQKAMQRAHSTDPSWIKDEDTWIKD